jgi:hypothetical protein
MVYSQLKNFCETCNVFASYVDHGIGTCAISEDVLLDMTNRGSLFQVLRVVHPLDHKLMYANVSPTESILRST